MIGRGRRNLFASSTWCTGPSGPVNEGKRDSYVSSSVTENGRLPYKVALVMLTMLPEVRSRG